MLDNIEAIEANYQRIWELLGQPGLLDLAAYRQFPYGQVFSGWVALAEAVRGARLEQTSVGAAVNHWLLTYPAHPAADSFANQLLDTMFADRRYPHQIALLLPLRGRLRPVSEAIRDGFLSAYFLGQDQESRPDIRIYAVDEDPQRFWETYNRALADGAKLLVGPLSKPAVNLLASRESLPMPVLSLNYSDPDAENIPPMELFQFGLLPEDEAHQSAQFIVENGYYRAAAIIPQGPWGQRLLVAFKESLEERGGQLVDHVAYAAERNDFSAPIQRLLSLQHSRSRRKGLQQSLGEELKFEPRRREDIDVIFIAAAPKNARLLKPQLSFHHAADIPVYATSHAFTGVPDIRADKDMDGLVYLDIPLVLDSGADAQLLREQVRTHWPEDTQRYIRLFALGVDAYNLIPDLGEATQQPRPASAGADGRAVRRYRATRASPTTVGLFRKRGTAAPGIARHRLCRKRAEFADARMTTRELGARAEESRANTLATQRPAVAAKQLSLPLGRNRPGHATRRCHRVRGSAVSFAPSVRRRNRQHRQTQAGKTGAHGASLPATRRVRQRQRTHRRSELCTRRSRGI